MVEGIQMSSYHSEKEDPDSGGENHNSSLRYYFRAVVSSIIVVSAVVGTTELRQQFYRTTDMLSETGQIDSFTEAVNDNSDKMEGTVDVNAPAAPPPLVYTKEQQLDLLLEHNAEQSSDSHSEVIGIINNTAATKEEGTKSKTVMSDVKNVSTSTSSMPSCVETCSHCMQEGDSEICATNCSNSEILHICHTCFSSGSPIKDSEFCHFGPTRKSPSTPKHVVFIVLDDVGYADTNFVGKRSPDLSAVTPFMTQMARESGVILSRYYAESTCTPGRVAILTGRYPFSVGMGHSMVYPASQWGLPKGIPLMPEIMRQNGYTTYIVGKWDIGHWARDHWPNARGFDSAFTLIQSDFDYYTGNVNVDGITYQDLHLNFDAVQYPRDIYSTTLWTDRAVNITNAHPKLEPMFLYLAFNGIHAPVSVDNDIKNSEVYRKLTSNLTWGDRKLFAGALYSVDCGVRDVYRALESQKMLSDSLLVIVSDNGAPSKGSGGTDAAEDAKQNGGSNWPLRGFKGHYFEGGIRVPAMIWSYELAPSLKGSSIHSHLFHASDWLPSIIQGYARGSLGDTITDGYNHWPYLIGNTSEWDREFIPFGMDYLEHGNGALIRGNLKLIKKFNCVGWYAYDSGNLTSQSGVNCSLKSEDAATRLYDLATDPSETINLHGVPEYATRELTLIQEYRSIYQNLTSDTAYKGEDEQAFSEAASRRGNTISYWMESANDASWFPKSDFMEKLIFV